MENHQHNPEDISYTCPMHPDVKGEKGDKCPKCGMDLVPVNNEPVYEVDLSTSSEIPEAGAPTDLVFFFKKNGNFLELEKSHEMKVHLMVVSEDLSWFRHVHPEESQEGVYTAEEVFPAGGFYHLFLDFKPKGAPPIVQRKEIRVAGPAKTPTDSPETKYESTVDGYTVILENGGDFKTNRSQPVQISIEKDGGKLTEEDLDMYLGASAHIVMVGKAETNYLHIHPSSDSRYTVYAETLIENEGTYRMWVQFQIKGKVLTADFTVKAETGKKADDDKHSHGHHH